MALPEVGSDAKDFTLTDKDGKTVSLADYAGKNVLLWYFPRAYGGNCTKQACSFRDHAADFEARNTEVLGITFSPPEELRSWAEETGLASGLLSDSDHSVAMAYGAADGPDQERPTRVSVLIGPDGKVLKTYTVTDAAAHPGEVLKDLG